jgi:hypothetical protein
LQSTPTIPKMRALGSPGGCRRNETEFRPAGRPIERARESASLQWPSSLRPPLTTLSWSRPCSAAHPVPNTRSLPGLPTEPSAPAPFPGTSNAAAAQPVPPYALPLSSDFSSRFFAPLFRLRPPCRCFPASQLHPRWVEGSDSVFSSLCRSLRDGTPLLAPAPLP